ncbi:hypothetical protein, partial [Klebsiella pneumoniae]|uniref:hypothetical protein n=1 Tax=Klebsiella pneumoniae TaxID=573 RepID=UPI001951B609
MSGSAFAVTHHAFSSGAGRTSDGNGSHASTLKSPSYTKSVSWQHYPLEVIKTQKILLDINQIEGRLETFEFSGSDGFFNKNRMVMSFMFKYCCAT